jgi:N-acetylglucosaminyldiphosphoundecaprenol N-acetyl-beta-D-mannosaminyltransferase
MISVKVGGVRIDSITWDNTLKEILNLVLAKKGGYVVTPNLQFIYENKNLMVEQALNKASLSVCDGWGTRALTFVKGRLVPDIIRGRQLIDPICKLASENNFPVMFFGSSPEVGDCCTNLLNSKYKSLVSSFYSPPIGFDQKISEFELAINQINSSKAKICFVALGCPKQELFMYRVAKMVTPCVMIGVGGSLDFIAGKQKCAPNWIASFGFETPYRLLQDPCRMWKRYILHYPQALVRGIFM